MKLGERRQFIRKSKYTRCTFLKKNINQLRFKLYKKNLPECPKYQICNGFCCETLMLILNFENLPMLTSLSPAVRHDRMRGGRNKFGPMYKRDRARKLQVHPMLQVQLWVLIGDLCSKCHQVWSFVINPPFPNDWHNF